MLWIALCLPDLPLQLAQRSFCNTAAPLVLVEGPALRPLVCCANSAAIERGITLGLPLAAARALASDLVVQPLVPTVTAQALHNLACWAGQFTPNVTLLPAGLLLEVASTLQLHGGLTRLLMHLRQGLAQLGYTAVPGVAPTPLAAWWLARARQAGFAVRMCRSAALLPERLAPLPLTVAEWPAELLQTLQTLGIRRLGQCLQLPRDAFIRRFGQAVRLELDRALGLLPDPRPWFTPPERFSSRVEFGFELNDAQALLFPLKRLLHELEGFLRARGSGVQQWQLRLDHWNHGHTRLTLGTVTPERSAARLLALARERLLQTTLGAPVLALAVVAEALQSFEECSQSLVPDARSHSLGWNQLLDRLTARLGKERISRLCAVDEHRPECSVQRSTALSGVAAPAVARTMSRARTTPTTSAITTAAAPRPLWLLEPPRLLSSRAGRPQCLGQLALLSGPERIEAGWWDGQAACRDYYVARNARGETLWIYREHRREPHWYLHGIFA